MQVSEEYLSKLINLLRERLEQFKVPTETLKNLRNDIVALLPEEQKKTPRGCAVMSGTASINADKFQKGENVDKNLAKPDII